MSKAGKQFDSLTDSINKTAKAAYDLTVINRNLKFATLGFNEQLAKLNGEYELAREKVGADSVAFKDLAKNEANLRAITEKRAATQLALAKATLAASDAQVKADMAARLSAEAMLPSMEAQSAARVALTNAENEYKLVLFDNQEQIMKRRMDDADLDLDLLIDGFDNRKTIAERVSALDSTTEQERSEMLANLRESQAANFKASEQILQGFADKTIDINDWINESDEKVLLKKVKNSGILERMGIRGLEVIKEMRTWTQDLNDLELANAQKNIDMKKKAFDASVTTFQKEQELARLKFDLEKSTDQKKAIFEAEQKLAADEQRLNAAKEFQIQMSDLDYQILQQKITNDKAELESAKALTDGKLELKKLENQALMNGLDIAIKVAGEESKVGKALARVQQILALKKAILDAKGALLKAWNSAPFPANLLAVGTVALSTAPIVSAISAIKFARGGVLEGASHAQGGIPLLGGRAEAEGGEAIINPKSTKAFTPILSAINSFNGWGDPFAGAEKSFFESGGVLPNIDRLTDSTATNTAVQYVPVLTVDSMQDALNRRNVVDVLVRGV
jgi:hypothetical protein